MKKKEHLAYMSVRPKINTMCRCGHKKEDHHQGVCVFCECGYYARQFLVQKNLSSKLHPLGVVTDARGHRELL